MIKTHGLTSHPLYHTWKNMMSRCYKASHVSYKNYGGRGIMVCDAWLDLATFVEDMWPRAEGLTLERRDVNLDYTPSNCCWISGFEQAANTRKTRLVTLEDGRVLHLREAARQLGISSGGLRHRLQSHGTTATPPKRSKKPPVLCSIEGCHRAAHARTWCPAHLKSWRKYGDPLKAKSRTMNPEGMAA